MARKARKMGKISGFLRGIVERNIIADDPDDEATQAFLENDKAIEAELARIAQYDAGLADVIRLHTTQTYTVSMMGFTPGFPYMGKLHASLVTPRLDSPRAPP